MRGIYYNGENAVYREDLPIPEREEGESLIKIEEISEKVKLLMQELTIINFNKVA